MYKLIVSVHKTQHYIIFFNPIPTRILGFVCACSNQRLISYFYLCHVITFTLLCFCLQYRIGLEFIRTHVVGVQPAFSHLGNFSFSVFANQANFNVSLQIWMREQFVQGGPAARPLLQASSHGVQEPRVQALLTVKVNWYVVITDCLNIVQC